MNSFKPIPEDKQPGWAARLSGLTLTSKFGTVMYGLTPAGYDGWAFRETGGGGAVTIPFAVDPSGDLLVGLILENRWNMGDKPVLCVIGGFVEEFDEDHAATQKREAQEEAGIDTQGSFLLKGLHTNSNRAFFIADAETEGVRAYGFRMDFKDLVEAEDGYILKPGFQHDGFKKPEAVRFYPWKLAAQKTADALARSAILQLIAMV